MAAVPPEYHRQRRMYMAEQARRGNEHGFLDTYDKKYCRCDLCAKRKSIWRKAKSNIKKEQAALFKIRQQAAFEEAMKEMKS